MLIAFAGMRVYAAEKGAANTARYAVVIGGLFQKDQFFPWFGLRITPLIEDEWLEVAIFGKDLANLRWVSSFGSVMEAGSLG
jgi:hypothetical protein